MRLPDDDVVEAAMDAFHDHSWREQKPVIYEIQMPELLAVLRPVIEQWITPKGSRAPSRKPAKVKPGAASQARARRLVRDRSGGVCEVCGVGRATNYQHRKARAHCTSEELWAVSNGLDVCGQGNATGCHGLIHQNPEGAKRNGWTVPFWADPRRAVVYRRSERVLLDDDGGFELVGGVSAVEGETQ